METAREKGQSVKDCEVCGRAARDKPQIFRNDPWCSDVCWKKYLEGEK